MDAGGTNPVISLQILDLSDANVLVELLLIDDLDAETRNARVFVNDTAGGLSSITFELPINDDENTIRATFSGNAYTFYVNDVPVGTNAPALPSISSISYVNFAMQPAGIIGTTMSASKVEITDCQF